MLFILPARFWATRKFLGLGLFLSGLLGLLTVPGLSQATGPLVSVYPAPTNQVLLNPGKGWVLYGPASDHTGGSDLAYGNIGYMRFDWSEIEPQEGAYNWGLIDQYISGWRAVGKKFAFGVMSSNTFSPQLYVTPKWVFDAGAASFTYNVTNPATGRVGPKVIPVWNDAIFKSKLQNFVKVLAARYDASPDLAFVDLRSYGNYGEGHNIPYGGYYLTDSELQQYIQWYLTGFHSTQLILPWGLQQYSAVYSWAVGQGLGLRRDGILDTYSNGSETAPAYNQAPAVFEFYTTYQQLLAQGRWSAQNLRTAVSNGKPSYISLGLWGNDARTFVSQQPTIVSQLANTMGYYFALQKAVFPASRGVGSTDTISLSWLNKGVAPTYLHPKVALGLVNSAGQIVAKTWLDSDPRSWLPATPVNESYSFSFGSQPADQYKLAIGLFENPNLLTPNIKLGIAGGRPDNWYILEGSSTPLPTPGADTTQDAPPALLQSQLRVNPDRVATLDPAQQITYTFKITNAGQGASTEGYINFPITSGQELGYATFSDKRLWVSQVVTPTEGDSYLRIVLPPMLPQEVVTGSVVLRVSPRASDGQSIFTRYTTNWSSLNRSGQSGTSNAVRLSVQKADNRNDTSGAVQLFSLATLQIGCHSGQTVQLKADFYAANESVSLWYTDKNQHSVGLITLQADSQGQLLYNVDTAPLQPGESYVIAGYGSNSGVTGSTVLNCS